MNKIKEVKEKVDILQVAEYFGLKLNRANKCVCPFHKEKTPSFSISSDRQIFHCFGCGVGGDVITLVSNLLHISNLKSAKTINDIFCLGVDFVAKTPVTIINRYKQKQRAKEEFKKWENKTFQLLCDYLHSLKRY